MKALFKVIGMIVTGVMLFTVFVNMSDEGKPAVPYDARKGVDPNWPEKTRGVLR